MKNTKRCSKCGRELPLDCFSKNKTKKDGLQGECKECRKQYDDKYRNENTDYFKQYRAEHADYFKQYKSKWNADHADEVATYGKQYRAEHADYLKQYGKQYRTEHVEERKQYDAERRATLEGYAYNIRCSNLGADIKYGRCGKDEDLLPPLEYYVWALQQRDLYDGKQYHWSEMGLDRIYNDKPHTFANVVPCSTANNKRRHRKSFEEFCELMRKENEELELVL